MKLSGIKLSILSGIFSATCICSYLSFSNINSATVSADDTQATLDELRTKQNNLSSDLDSLNSELDTIGDQLNKISSNMTDTQNEINTLADELESLEAEKSTKYEEMKLRIQYCYESQRTSIIEAFVGSANFADFLNKAEYLQSITDYNRNQIKELDEIYQAQKTKQDELNKNLANLSELQEASYIQSDNLKNVISTKTTELSLSDSQIAELEDISKQYEYQIEEQRLAAEEAKASASSVSSSSDSTTSESASNNSSSSIVADSDNSINTDNNNNNSSNNSSNSSSNSNNNNNSNNNDSSSIENASDLDMMAAIIECEAGDQPYEGRIAVGSVIMNRIESPDFPNTLYDVLYQKGQFTPVMSGRFEIVLKRGASATDRQAAAEVLSGVRNVPYLYFHMYTGKTNNYSSWTIIGDHILYNY